MAVQTLQQRAGNAKFNKLQDKKRGKPRALFKKSEPAPLSKRWVYTIFFLICGGAVLELLRYFI